MSSIEKADTPDDQKIENNTDLNLLISLEINELQSILDKQLPDIFLENFSPGDSGVQLTVRKKGRVKFSAENSTIEYQVPLDLKVEKQTLLGNIDVTFGIVLGFETQFLIQENWAIKTRTNIKKYQWTEKPKLDLGLFKIPLDTFVINTLEENEDSICQQIDERAMKELNIRPHLNQLLSTLPNPIQMVAPFALWWQSPLVKTFMTGLRTEDHQIRLGIGLQLPLQISVGYPLERLTTEVKAPEFVKNLKSDSTLQTKVLIDFLIIQKLAMDFFSKQTFEIAGQKIRVHDVRLEKQGEKLKVNHFITGSFKGNLTVSASLVYDAVAQNIQILDIETDLTGNNFKSRTAAFFLQNKVEAELKKLAQFPLTNFITTLNNTIANQEFAPGMNLKANLKSFDIQKIKVLENALECDLTAVGNAQFLLRSPAEFV